MISTLAITRARSPRRPRSKDITATTSWLRGSPTGPGPFPGIVLIHHMPGWDEFYRETARRFAHHGYITVCPDLYARAGAGKPDDVTAKIRGEGGVADDSVVGDCEGRWSTSARCPIASGKVGIIGTCSGGRNAVLVAGRTQKFDAVADLWGGASHRGP